MTGIQPVIHLSNVDKVEKLALSGLPIKSCLQPLRAFAIPLMLIIGSAGITSALQVADRAPNLLSYVRERGQIGSFCASRLLRSLLLSSLLLSSPSSLHRTGQQRNHLLSRVGRFDLETEENGVFKN